MPIQVSHRQDRKLISTPTQPLLAATCLAVPLADTSSGYAANDKKDIFTPITGRNYAPIPKPGAGAKPAYSGHKIQARDSSPQLYHEQVG